MKINKKVLISIVVLLSIFTLIFISCFTINITSQYDSSGGTSRNLESSLVFRFNRVVAGHQNYTVSPGRGCDSGAGDCGSHVECIVENHQWVDSFTKNKCSIPLDVVHIPLTKKEVYRQITTGEFKPKNSSCTHGDFCYEIVRP